MNKNKVATEKSEKNAAKMELIKSLVKKDLKTLASGDAACCGGGFGWCK